MNLIRLTAVALTISGLTACGIIRDKSNDYSDIARVEPLTVPEWYESSRIESKYPVPPIDVRGSLTGKFIMPPPPDATIAILTDSYVIESLNEQTWLLVNEAPGRIWPSLDRFWEENGTIVDYENPSLGLMQTEVAGSTLLSKQLLDRLEIEGVAGRRPLIFQAKMGQGVKRNTTELQVRVVTTKKGKQDFQGWSGLPLNKVAETKLLEIISSYLENSQSNRSYSLVATDIGGESRVTMVTGSDGPSYINLNLSFDRAWNAVTRALRDSNIKVADLDRSNGEVYLDYGYVEEEKGWLASLFSGDEPERAEFNYIIEIKKANDGYHVKVISIDRNQPKSEEMEILNLLLDNIS